MLKLRFSKPSYYTHDDGDVTLCVYKCTVYETESRAIIKRFKVTGKAIYAECDSYSSSVGRMIADSRAKKKAYQTALMNNADEAYQEAKELKEKCQERMNFIDKMRYLNRCETNHIKFLCNL